MTTINTTHQIFSITEVYEIAKDMQANDDDWTYKVVPNPNPNGPNTAVIEVYDGDDQFIALL